MENQNQENNIEPVEEQQKITKKDLLYNFFLLRFIGSVVLLGVIGGLVELFDWDGSLIVGILSITMFNIPVQLFILIKAIIQYFTDKKSTE